MRDELEAGNAVLQTIHASEGGRALKLLQQRQKRQKALQKAKQDIEIKAQKRQIESTDSRYQGSSTQAFEEAFQHDTVGLVTAEQFREKRKRLAEKLEETTKPPVTSEEKTLPKLKPKKTLEVKRNKLSFQDEDLDDPCESVSQSPSSKQYFGKDPFIDTTFLTDAAREEKLKQEKERLIQEYKEKQEQIKEQWVELTYVYWDGVCSQKYIQVKQGSTVGLFLNSCCKVLSKEFHELQGVSTDALLYVKDGVILPASITFYALIKAKSSGQSVTLFDIVPTENQSTVDGHILEKDQGPVGKIVEKRWYERNKHIYPASSWEQYVPGKSYSNKFKILI